jgi:hypothetical protein
LIKIKGIRWFQSKPFNLTKTIRIKDNEKAKRVAKRVADEHRDIGLRARVIKTKHGYDVWTTYQPEGAMIIKISKEMIDKKKFLRKMR